MVRRTCPSLAQARAPLLGLSSAIQGAQGGAGLLAVLREAAWKVLGLVFRDLPPPYFPFLLACHSPDGEGICSSSGCKDRGNTVPAFRFFRVSRWGQWTLTTSVMACLGVSEPQQASLGLVKGLRDQDATLSVQTMVLCGPAGFIHHGAKSVFIKRAPRWAVFPAL